MTRATTPRPARRVDARLTAPVAVLVAANLVTAVAAGAALCWSGAIPVVMAVHGALMIVAWGAVLPLGGVVARWFKVTPAQDFPAEYDNPFWWNAHRVLQYGGVALATVALGVILSETHGRFDTLHGRCGLAVMGVAWLQVASPLMRGSKGGPTDAGAHPDDPATWRGDHYDMTPRRRLFEAWHKRAGWGLIVLANVTLLLGADLAGAPAWLFGALGVLQASLVLAAVDCRLRCRWVDTYAALWGRPKAGPERAPQEPAQGWAPRHG